MLNAKPLILLIFLLILSACSKGPDVRIVLCQDLTKDFLDNTTDLKWTKEEIKVISMEEVQTLISFESAAKTGNSVCYFKYEDDMDVVDEVGAPLSVYSTYPYKMTVNGKKINAKELVDRVNKVMLKQGKQLIRKIEKL